MSLADQARVQNQALDRLNDALNRAEATFAGLRLGVRAKVAFPDGEWLIFGKAGRVWRLLVTAQKGTVEGPLVDASKRRRKAAVALLPDLFQAMNQALVIEIREVEEAIENVDAFLAELTEG